jgi:nucleotide-binding universal stress UspA family protein
MYKTIVMHCNDKRRISALLAPTVSLADTFEAHLTALSVVPPVIVTGAPSGRAIVIDTHCEQYRAENPAMRSAFEEATRGRTLVAEWCDEGAAGAPVADVVLRYARAADLVVAAQADPEWPGSYHLDVADLLAVESGRPVLIIPNSAANDRVGEKVLVAWNARREAARAVFDALPLLQRAQDLKVVWVNPQPEKGVAQDLPAADICATLARHGVKCQAAEQIKPRTNVGETLLSCAADFGADLLVMGCYGHTRLREFIFGGATRHVLSRATIPVLMSH